MLEKLIMYKFISLVIIFSVLLFTAPSTLAIENQASDGAVPTDSYTVFWPLVAGKTEGDSLYSLKLLKEQVMSWLTFGDNKKADYAVMLGTKRVLEVENLIKDNKTEQAQKTLERADGEYTKAYNYMKKAGSTGKFSAKEIRRDRLINVKNLLDSLQISTSGDIQVKIESVKEKVNLLLRDYLP